MRDIWQDAFDAAIEAGETSFAASKAGDDAVADYLASRADDAYDHWRDRQIEREATTLRSVGGKG